MRHIERYSEPEILKRQHEKWKAAYEEKLRLNSQARPDVSKYRHKEILDALGSLSFHKCFYCESILSNPLAEVDHFVEVAEAPSLAYEWTNLYLSCRNCNRKLPNRTIPVTTVLDPCRDSDEEIRQEITFKDECVCSRPGSEKGLQTIAKYRLDTEFLDLKRLRRLKSLMKEADEIHKEMILQGRQYPNEEEKERIAIYSQGDQPYSMMCGIYISEKLREFML